MIRTPRPENSLLKLSGLTAVGGKSVRV